MFYKSLALLFGFWKTTHTFLPSTTSLNVLHDALFVVCFRLNTLFLLFCTFLTCNCISCAYIVAVYTVNRPSTRYCLFWTVENVPLTFGVVLRSLKHQPYLCSHFQISKYVKRYLVCCLSACKYTICAVLRHFNS